VYCRFCTRSYAVGEKTDTVTKKPQKPSRRRWEVVFQHIESHPDLHDIVVSGGDAYYLEPDNLLEIGQRYEQSLRCVHNKILTSNILCCGLD
jgi:lysine 2,3-aminomutase